MGEKLPGSNGGETIDLILNGFKSFTIVNIQLFSNISPMTIALSLEVASSQYWTWREFKIHYVKAGTRNDRPPLLLVHGFGASTDHWKKNIAVLKNDFEVYAIDLLGFGRSQKADTAYSSDLWCEQLSDFVKEIIGRPAIIVGNSIGGYAALATASQFPDQADRKSVV